MLLLLERESVSCCASILIIQENMEEHLKSLLEEEEEEELLLLTQLLEEDAERIRQPHDLYVTRESEGFQEILIGRHLMQDDSMFRKFFRLNVKQFNYVLSIIEDDIRKEPTPKVKRPISPAEMLGVTLRFLATGESYVSLAFAFRISPSYISRIVAEVLKICSQKLPAIFMPKPEKEDLLKLASEFQEKWNFPNCIAAVDGKHIRIFCPGKSGSLFFNYKDFFSIVLLAFVDANYKFVMVDIGSYGKEGDSGIMQKSQIRRLLDNEDFYPNPKILPKSDVPAPFVIVGDEAFRLSSHLMKPFARNDARAEETKSVFNYRLSRARRVSENSFALLSQIFRIFYRPIAVKPDVTDALIMTACCLHNMLRDAYLEVENTPFFNVNIANGTPELPTENMTPLRGGGGFANAEGFDVRNLYMDYFNSPEGSVPWQIRHVNRTDR